MKICERRCSLVYATGLLVFILVTTPFTHGRLETSRDNQVFHSSDTQIVDLVVTNADENDISFIPGKGTGEFGSPHNHPCGQNPTAIVAEDFNKDGNLDCAVTNWETAQVSVLIGDGIGGFSSPQQHSVVSNPYDVAVGDFNRDGNLDVAVPNADEENIHSSVSVLFGDGHGGFSEKHDFPVGYDPTGIAVADFNNDSNLDIAVANAFDGTVGILLGNGSGGFADCSFYPVDIGILDLGVGDFNHDHHLDLVTANQLGNTLNLLLDDGQGGFGSPLVFPVAGGGDPWQIAVDDFDKDGNCDVAVTNQGGYTVTVFLGNGNGGFKGDKNYPVAASPIGIIAADFNSDSYPDLAVANSEDAVVIVLFNDGTGGFSNPVGIAVGNAPFGLAAGRFRKDTAPPVVSITKPENAIYIANRKLLPFSKPIIIGKIDIEVNTSDNESEIDHVLFYVDDTLVYTDIEAPYSWIWSTRSFFSHTIKVVSYDGANNSASDELTVMKFF